VAVGSGRYLIPFAGGVDTDPAIPHDVVATRMKTDGTVLDSPEILLTADLGGDLLVTNGIDASVHRYDGRTGAFESVFVSPGSGGLDNPQALVYGPDGNLYIASFGSRNVLRYDGRTGAFLGVFVPPGSGGLGAPGEISFGPDGNLYVSDSFFGTNSVLRYDGKTGAFLGVFASGGGLVVPQRLVFGAGFLFVQSVLSRDVLRYDGKTGAPRPAPGQSGAIFIPGVDATALTLGPDGRLYVTTRADEVRRYNPKTGALLNVFVPAGSGGLGDGNDMEFGPDRNLYIPDFLPSSVLRYDGRTGDFLGAFVPPGGGGLEFPVTLTFMPTFDPHECRKTGHD
jgi:streptogramin lyase